MIQTTTLKRNDGTTDVVFNISPTSDGTILFKDQAGTPATPTIIKVSFQDKAPGQKGSDRRNVLCQIVSVDANGISDVTSVSLQWTLPRSTAGLPSKYDDALALLLNFLSLPGMKTAIKQGRVA